MKSPTSGYTCDTTGSIEPVRRTEAPLAPTAAAPSVAPLTAADVGAECGPWPLPGAGSTRDRWDHLVDLGRRDLALAKVVEPHHDALAIVAELGGPAVEAGQVWAVWAAEPPFAVLHALRSGDGWCLTGRKAFCSGSSLVTHALVTAETDEGARLFAVKADDAGVHVDDSGPRWIGPGMQRARTVTLRFDDVEAVAVGPAGAYTDRAGFWLGGIGVAACWFGGTLGVAATLAEGAEGLGPHGLAHLGAVRAGTETFALALEGAAVRADEGLTATAAQRLSLVLRAQAADLAEDVVSRVGRSTGPGPLAFDEQHARRVADLAVFVRQHHAERDLEALGRLR